MRPNALISETSGSLRLPVLLLLVLPLLAAATYAPEAPDPGAAVTCIEEGLEEGQGSAEALLGCVPGVRRDQVTMVDLGQSSAQCALYSQWPFVASGPAPLDLVSMTNWWALSVCDVEAIHVWVGQLHNTDIGSTMYVVPGVSDYPTKVAYFNVEQPCATTPDGMYQVTVTAQYKPLELTALPVAAVNSSSPQSIACPLP
jgi:hypothetical protein